MQNTAVTTTGEAPALPSFAEINQHVQDPVIRRKARELARALKVGQRFKRIDMAFLQMLGESGLPRFAILPLGFYRALAVCEWTGREFHFIPPVGNSVLMFGELFSNYTGTVSTATPEVTIPQGVEAVLDEVKADFDELFVAWEARWQPRKGDPLVIGRIGPDLFFLVASWDTTKLESYIVSEF